MFARKRRDNIPSKNWFSKRECGGRCMVGKGPAEIFIWNFLVLDGALWLFVTSSHDADGPEAFFFGPGLEQREKIIFRSSSYEKECFQP